MNDDDDDDNDCKKNLKQVQKGIGEREIFPD